MAACRERCWRTNWVVDLDIKAFFDSVDHDLVMRAVERHTGRKWILLYVQRWLKAPMRMRDGATVARTRGTPQGSAIFPLLANLFLHYAFDMWMAREFPGVPFERYCDDAVVHCRSEGRAHRVRDALAARVAQVGLELHPDKTRVVYRKDADRRGSYEHTSFTLLQGQHGRCPLCGSLLLHADQEPQSPQEWEQWPRATRTAVRGNALTLTPDAGQPDDRVAFRLIHVHCHRRRGSREPVNLAARGPSGPA
ncbi:reverse transcriptase domain-containing protein [Streptomyces melanosporofaciens]|uniref:reverse transcriptase domain-containing protein n=1 Tax=Streptomyces sp. CY1 TaxID=3388313 RepID=UPI0039A2746E